MFLRGYKKQVATTTIQFVLVDVMHLMAGWRVHDDTVQQAGAPLYPATNQIGVPIMPKPPAKLRQALKINR